jgi:hypothetical protein
MAIDFMRDPAPIPQFDAEQPITKLLHLIWTSRPDLQAAFDLSTREGHDAFRSWAREGVRREYGVDPSSFGDAASDGAQESARAEPGLLSSLKALFLGRSRIKPSSGLPGATLIGYTHGVLGMGEHVRMSAEALSTANVPFGVLDIDTGDRPDALTGAYPVVSTNGFRANIFHVNADQMLPTYCRLGSAFYANRYNIGFWAWELAKWPAPWEPVLEMVDEVWAPSKFIQDCLKSATDKPVVHMPLCVELPAFQKLPRSRFGLPEGSCLFLFAFDFNSYIERKNPFAAIRAFKSAFPAGTESAGLVVKVMKADETSIRWREMMDLIGGDARIHVINEVMSRGEVLALIDACDCFVSLYSHDISDRLIYEAPDLKADTRLQKEVAEIIAGKFSEATKWINDRFFPDGGGLGLELDEAPRDKAAEDSIERPLKIAFDWALEAIENRNHVHPGAAASD